MKILNIYFKNINSLEGESRIHFDKSPIVEGGVFAITGPNGSGKSSVLDAITLGLYGETFRFDRPAEHVMTKATVDSFSEVEFALGNDKYKASWQVARADDSATSELLAPEMKLVQLNGSEQVLGQSVQKVREKMLELTGMDFHKFSKSMVLAQGDFAAFLNALDSERMDILEKISGSDIYAEYSQQVEVKFQQAQTRLQQLEQDLVATPVMDEATKEAREHDLADFKEQQTELKIEQDAVEQQLGWLQNISSLEKQVVSVTRQQKELEGQQDASQQSLAEIEASKGILDFEPALATLDQKVEAVKQSKKTLDSYRHEVELLQKELDASAFDDKAMTSTLTLTQQKDKIEQASSKLSNVQFSLSKETALLQSLEQQKQQKTTDLTEVESWLQSHDSDKTLLDNFPETEKLIAAQTELSALTTKQAANAKQTKNVTKALANKKAEISSFKAKNKQLKVELAENEETVKSLSDGSSLPELQEMQVEQQERVLNFQELFDLAAVNAKLGNKGFFSQIFGSKNEDKEELQLKKQHDLLQLEIGREKNVIATLELAVTNEALLKKMAADRPHLVDGKACPLCGALKHPYAKHLPAASNSKQVLKEQQKKIKKLLADEISLSKEIVSVQKLADKNDQKEDKLQNVRSQWNALANRLNAYSLDLTIDNLALMKDLLKGEKQELTNVSNLLKKTGKLHVSMAQAKETLTTQAAALERTIKEEQVLSAEWDNRPTDMVELEQAYNQAVEKEKTLAGKVEKQLEQLGEKMPKKSKNDAFFKQLTQRKQAYQSQSKTLKPLAEDIKQLDVSIVDSSAKLTQMNQEIQQYSDEVQQQESAGIHLSLTEKQKMIAEKENAFSQQESELVVLQQALQDDIKHTAAADVTALRELIGFVQGETELQQKHKVLVDKTEGLKHKQQDLALQIETEQALAVTAETEYDLTGRRSVVKRKLDIARQEVVSLQNKLDKQGELQQKQGLIVDKIADQKLQLTDCEAEMKLVASEGNINFRRKVQQVISDQLMTQTNQVLEKISGRYYVRKVDSEHGLAIEIEDTKQHNVRRLPKTLSGGESFIVSLALALGMAEMASNGHALDSLFIDEGFGNLDAESLYLAMTALENLQTHGKVVGVISHIDGVKKRIKTQIEMIKKPNGLSALKMVS